MGGFFSFPGVGQQCGKRSPGGREKDRISQDLPENGQFVQFMLLFSALAACKTVLTWPGMSFTPVRIRTGYTKAARPPAGLLFVWICFTVLIECTPPIEGGALCTSQQKLDTNK